MPRVTRKAGANDKLAKLREKLENVDLTSKGGGSNWFNPQEGQNVIRILPEVGEMEYFFQPVGRHYLSKEEWVYCPQIISEGEYECPICDTVKMLYKSGDKDTAGKIRAREQWWVNIIDRSDQGVGPKVYPMNKTVFSAVVSIVNDPDYGYIMDPYDGVDLVIEKTKTGSNAWDVDYSILPRRHSTPLATLPGKNDPDDDAIDAILEAAKELTWAELSDDPEEDAEIQEKYGITFKPYDRIVKDHLGGTLSDDSDDVVEDDDSDEVVEEAPAVKDVQERRARRTRNRKAITK